MTVLSLYNAVFSPDLQKLAGYSEKLASLTSHFKVQQMFELLFLEIFPKLFVCKIKSLEFVESVGRNVWIAAVFPETVSYTFTK